MSKLHSHYPARDMTIEIPNHLSIEGAPVYGLMVILVVCLWHEPDSQLFDTEAT